MTLGEHDLEFLAKNLFLVLLNILDGMIKWCDFQNVHKFHLKLFLNDTAFKLVLIVNMIHVDSSWLEQLTCAQKTSQLLQF